MEKEQVKNQGEELLGDSRDIVIRKKSGHLEDWQPEKIAKAICKSADRIAVTLTEKQIETVVGIVKAHIYAYMQEHDNSVISVEHVHGFVEMALKVVNPSVAESYMDYRNWVKKEAEMNAKVWEECQTIQFIGDKNNANADSAMVSTKRVKKLDILETAQFRAYFLNSEEKLAESVGYIYFHDKSARMDCPNNCCLFDIKSVLTGGFEMGNIWYNEPKTLDTAFDVIGDITLMAASQQYGGFTLPEVDSVLESYAEKSFQKYKQKYEAMLMRIPDDPGQIQEMASEEAFKDVIREMEQGFQGWEYKFNTVASSRGDYPFITISLGLCNSMWGKELCKAALRVRRMGQGKAGHKKPVLFPKIVFLYDESLHGKGGPMEDVFEEGIQCSAKTMYPDWLSLTGKGYVPEMYQKYGEAISPMGCRAFLSPWYERGGMHPADERDVPIFTGRFNIGVVSLNLPMIYAKAERENKDFYEVLDYYLEMIRKFHLRTYEFLSHMKASSNALGFCEGGFYGGHLDLNDTIGPCLESATASFGITALNELQRIHNGKSLVSDGQFALEVMAHIAEKIEQFKQEDGKLYAIYGTPAESLCYTQVKQFRKEYGVITNVSDRPYVSNSFHCHVTEEISPILKQDLEERFWNYFNGGKIQYCRYPVAYNYEAIRTLVRRAMKKGFYEGVNLSLAYCDDCGHEELEMDVCPVCGSRNLTKIDRMNGYLAYSRVHGDTRLNEGKMAEIADRVSM